MNTQLDKQPASPAQSQEISNDSHPPYLERSAIIRAAEVGIVGLEVTPANEAARLALFGTAYAITGDSMASASVYGAATMVIEGGAAIATADLLNSDKGQKAIEWTNNKLESIGLPRDAKTNSAMKVGIATVGGNAVLLSVKQREEPNRSFSENVRYGVASAFGLAAMCTLQGYLVAESVNYPKPETIGAASIAVGGLFALARRVKRKGKELKKIITKENYIEIMEESALGPQRGGIADYDLDKVLNDKETIIVPFGNEGISWPLLTPLTNNTEYLQNYFSTFRPDVKYLHLSLPSNNELDSNSDFAEKAAEEISAVLSGGKSIVFEESPGHDITKFLADAGIDEETIEFDYFVDPKNDSRASVIHFAGLSDVKMSNEDGRECSLREAYELLDKDGETSEYNGTMLLDHKRLTDFLPAADKSVLERLWEIYIGQFQQLVENNPARQVQTYDEFKSMVESRDTLTVAHAIDGDIVSFGMFVGNIETCDWLNTKFYEEKFEKDDALFFPGIATDIEKGGQKYALDLIELIAKMISKSGQNKHIVFQCTNISADYIPKIVENAALATGMSEIHLEEFWRYNYIAISKKDNQ